MDMTKRGQSPGTGNGVRIYRVKQWAIIIQSSTRTLIKSFGTRYHGPHKRGITSLLTMRAPFRKWAKERGLRGCHLDLARLGEFNPFSELSLR